MTESLKMAAQGIWTTLLIIAVALLNPVISFAEESHRIIKVEDGHVQHNVVSMQAKLKEKRIHLDCFQTETACKLLDPGEYDMVRLPPGEGPYNDCTNVDLYTKSASGRKKLGRYCLTGEGEGGYMIESWPLTPIELE